MCKFYGWKNADVKDERSLTPRDYYNILSKCWCAETCARECVLIGLLTTEL